jgi:putative acetyltransferase
MEIAIRKIEQSDDKAIAKIIRNSLEEFHANKKGTVYYDETTNHVSSIFSLPGSIYYIAAGMDKILGGAGIFPTEGLPDGVCELVKMYLIPEARGIGLGKQLMEKCFSFAKSYGYHTLYIETLPELDIAVKVYDHLGFNRINHPLGNSKHTGCSIWMVKPV